MNTPTKDSRSQPGQRAVRPPSGVLLGVGWLALLLAYSSGCEPQESPVQPAREITSAASKDATVAQRADVIPASGESVDGAKPVAVALHAATPVNDSDDPRGSLTSPTVPEWAADAIFYQLFPERFANGDERNDPTRESLEFADAVPQDWAISPWTGDWYARAAWERALGPNFFEHGVFHRRYGGDLQGVIDKLDYLQTLGINTIYFNPVFYARSLHKYDGNSYHHVDPYFGPDPDGDLALIAEETSDPASWHWTAADKLFLELIRQAHERGLRVIIDGVFNHTGRDFFAFADVRHRQAESPYRDWYLVQHFDDPTTPQSEFRYKGWWGVDTLPEFANNEAGNDLHSGPKQYVFDSTQRWMDPNGDGDPADGIDGWRLDVANEVPTGFWRDWHKHARRINPECYTVAEIWNDARQFLQEGGFSASMNYHGFAFPTKGFLIDEVLSPTAAARDLDERRKGFPRPVQYAVQSLIDSHDTDRLASMIVNAGQRPYEMPERFDYDHGVSPRNVPSYDVRKPSDDERRVQRLVALLQMTYVGAPMIYYGTEAGMWGADDPCDRMPMVWPELAYDPQAEDPLGRQREPDPVAFEVPLFNFYQAAIRMRRASSALRRGDLEFVATDDEAQFLAFKRFTDDETLFIGLNRGDAPHKWTIPLEAQQTVDQVFVASDNLEGSDRAALAEGVSGADSAIIVEHSAGKAVVTVPACDGVVVKLRDKE